MGRAKSMVSLLLVLFLVRAHVATTETTTEFIFHGFKGNQSEIHMQGDSTITSNGLLRLTDRNSDVVGTAFYHKPVRLLDSNSTNTTVRSFSTSFIFIIPSSSTSNGGFGFTFTLSPTPNRTDADPEQYMGLLNERNDGNSSNHVFAVEFDTVQGFKDGTNRIGNHIGLNFNSLSSDVQEPVAYFNNNDSQKEEFQLVSGEPIQVFLDYHGPTKTLNLTVYPTRLGYKPRIPLISREVPKLSDIVVDEMFVGFTAATGRHGQSSAHYVMGWSFASGGEHPLAAMLDISQLPPPPPNKAKKRGYNADWVMELQASGEILSAIDPRLGSGYDEGEARLALAVGLLCCHHKPESRPPMRMVLRYLNRDEDVPEIHDNWGYSDSSRTDLGSKLVGYISSDRASSSHSHTSSSLTRISSTSLISGR
ncbi:unnamed protein product [Arabidopsis thaliana]|uniref:(thale cress) hypothetical protein n=1 Tax=Arabidopsis thaliana TaxID=3702 RepID=A0A7G2F7W0_ARATH|nr:unnamed protein product [Arabidopsis thaliana]